MTGIFIILNFPTSKSGKKEGSDKFEKVVHCIDMKGKSRENDENLFRNVEIRMNNERGSSVLSQQHVTVGHGLSLANAVPLKAD